MELIERAVSSLHLRAPDPDRLAAALARNQVASPRHGPWVTIYGGRSDWHALYLCRETGADALAVELEPFSVLRLALWRAGEQRFVYTLNLDLSRGDIDPEAIDRGARGVAEELLPCCKPATSLQELDELVRAVRPHDPAARAQEIVRLEKGLRDSLERGSPLDVEFFKGRLERVRSAPIEPTRGRTAMWVWRALCASLELDVAYSLVDDARAAPGYPSGYLVPAARF